MFSGRLKQLGEEFLRHSCAELVLLRMHLPQARIGEAEALLDMQRVVHRISGSGALLGFKTVSDAAAKIERILRRAESVPTAAEWLVIEAQLQSMDDELTKLKTAPEAE